MAKGKLSTMRMEDIKPYPNNPRRNDGAVDAVAESIRQCGYVAPIIVDEDGVILAGHTRYKALQQLGYKAADVLIKSGMTEEQKKKYRLLDNKTSELAQWDFELLADELENMDFGGFDFGLDAQELSGMEFMDFDGPGDGGGSRMQTGTKVRCVIGPLMFDIDDADHSLYDACRDIHPEAARDYIIQGIMGGFE